MADQFRTNYAYVRDAIGEACSRAGRDASGVTLVAVTKTVEPGPINAAIEAGIIHLGENRPQEIVRKRPFVGDDVHWHLIGQLQRNKVKDMIGISWLIHSLDRVSLADEIEKRAAQRDVVQPVLVQVNISGEDTKSGMASGEAIHFIEEMEARPHLKVMGLMTMAPYFAEPEEARPVFKKAKVLYDSIVEMNCPHTDMRYLSMGMSNDYEIAVEEGATMVRIGRALFGERVYG